MARGRMLARTLSTSEKFARLFDVCPELAEFCQSLYPLLMAHADDFGRQQGDVFTVRHSVHPTSPRAAADFERALTLLHQVGLLIRYEVKGRFYLQIVKFDEHQQGLHKRSRSQFPAVPGDSWGTPEESEKGADSPEQGKGTEGKGSEANLTEGKKGVGADAPDPAILMSLWNAITQKPLPQCRELTPTRKRRALSRMRERSIQAWEAIIVRIQASNFCRGENDRGWLASFDWLLQPDVAVKVLEGKYDDRKGAASKTVTQHAHAMHERSNSQLQSQRDLAEQKRRPA